jgi:alpha-L-fucosidase 2
MDQDLAKKAETARSKLLPYQIGKWGQLQEWSKDFDESEPGHRHMSHLLGLHPGFQITPRGTPQFAAAAKRTLERRFNFGGPATGWSCAWKINHWARLESGEESYLFVVSLLRKSTFPNLFDAHPPFQIDGNFGGTAGIAEMLVQSHAGEINLLPALPKAWADGEFRGLRARGGFILNLSWKNGLLVDGSIIAQNRELCILRYSHLVNVLCENNPITCEKVSENVIRFQAEAGKTYQIYIS